MAQAQALALAQARGHHFTFSALVLDANDEDPAYALHSFALLCRTNEPAEAGPANYLKRAPGKPDPWFRVPASVLGSEELS